MALLKALGGASVVRKEAAVFHRQGKGRYRRRHQASGHDPWPFHFPPGARHGRIATKTVKEHRLIPAGD